MHDVRVDPFGLRAAVAWALLRETTHTATDVQFYLPAPAHMAGAVMAEVKPAQTAPMARAAITVSRVGMAAPGPRLRAEEAAGGGSSFIEKTASNVKNIRGGAPIGDGLVVISW